MPKYVINESTCPITFDIFDAQKHNNLNFYFNSKNIFENENVDNKIMWLKKYNTTSTSLENIFFANQKSFDKYWKLNKSFLENKYGDFPSDFHLSMAIHVNFINIHSAKISDNSSDSDLDSESSDPVDSIDSDNQSDNQSDSESSDLVDPVDPDNQSDSDSDDQSSSEPDGNNDDQLNNQSIDSDDQSDSNSDSQSD